MRKFRKYNQTIKFLQCSDEVSDKIFSNIKETKAKVNLIISILPENILDEKNYFCTSLNFKELELEDTSYRSRVNKDLAKTSLCFFYKENKYIVNPYYVNVIGPQKFELIENELQNSIYKDFHPLIGMMALTIYEVAGYKNETRGLHYADKYLSTLGLSR